MPPLTGDVKMDEYKLENIKYNYDGECAYGQVVELKSTAGAEMYALSFDGEGLSDKSRILTDEHGAIKTWGTLDALYAFAKAHHVCISNYVYTIGGYKWDTNGRTKHWSEL